VPIASGAARPIAVVAAVLATPLAVGILRVLPPTPVGSSTWLTAAACGALALASVATGARFLARALRDGSPRDGLVSLGGVTLAAAAGVGALAGSAPPPLPVLLGLAVASAAWLGAAMLDGAPRIPATIVAGGALAGAVLIGAATLFPTWSATGGVALGAFATLSLGTATGLAMRRSSLPVLPLALFAGGAAALAVSRSGSAEGVVAMVPLATALVLLGTEPAQSTPVPATASDRSGAQRLPRLASALAEGLLLVDAEERIVDWNLAAGALLELGADPRGQPAAEVLAPLVGDMPWTTQSMPSGEAARRMVTERGRPLELTVTDVGGGGRVVVVRDLALERSEATDASRLARELRGTIEELLDARRTIGLQRAEIERAAQLDPLTRASRRRPFLERLHAEVAQARRYSHPIVLLVIDVDGLAEVNRQHGSAVGDAVLRELALRLRLRMREADALGRLGGDAFAVILPHTDERGAAVFADAVLRRMVGRPIPTSAGPLTVTLSIGVALMQAGMDLDDEALLAAAEEALASARRGGGNRIAFDRRHGLARLEDRLSGAPTERPRDDAASADEHSA
jgi:diguanylate cyclase (GGDEF)-like protein